MLDAAVIEKVPALAHFVMLGCRSNPWRAVPTAIRPIPSQGQPRCRGCEPPGAPGRLFLSLTLDPDGSDFVAGRDRIEVPFLPVDEASVGVAQPHRVLDQAIEHRLKIERRAADHFEDVASGRLLFQRLREIAVASPQLGEQAHVFEGDDRLIGEALQQSDLSLREEAGLGAAEDDHPDRGTLSN